MGMQNAAKALEIAFLKWEFGHKAILAVEFY